MIQTQNKRLLNVVKTAAKASKFPVNILITGASGVGKEVLARYIHKRTEKYRNCKLPFIGINCTAMPEGLLESELFGHERGAFSGAQKAHKGLLRSAESGTILLDEIGDMPLILQSKLLRCIETKCVTPIGSTKEIPFKARIISATNCDIKQLIENGKFREDLYYRINTVELYIPSLAERQEDIPILFETLIYKTAHTFGCSIDDLKIDNDVIDTLLIARLDGNVRQLRNIAERLIVNCYDMKNKSLHVTKQDIQNLLTVENSVQYTFNTDNFVEAKTEFEHTFITHLVSKYGTIKKAAQKAGISYSTALRCLKKRLVNC